MLLLLLWLFSLPPFPRPRGFCLPDRPRGLRFPPPRCRLLLLLLMLLGLEEVVLPVVLLPTLPTEAVELLLCLPPPLRPGRRCPDDISYTLDSV
jgi:hypothetical protein